MFVKYILSNLGDLEMWPNETNTDIYVHLKNLFLADVVTLLYKYEVR